MNPYCVPEHHIGILDRAVGLCPCRQPRSASMLVRIISRGVSFRRVVGSDPEMFRGEISSLEYTDSG
jgi:hypothetical protein